jgi:hypothetical protein
MAIGETQLMGSDVPPERFQPMRSVYLSLAVDSSEETDRIFKLLTRAARSSCRWRIPSVRFASACCETGSARRG